ncbi:MAG: hypothetical protein IPH23_14615 [Gammaproteobacteria bacterium]|nr:hypothetical protein [Gammaproteobacteria bacterium]
MIQHTLEPFCLTIEPAGLVVRIAADDVHWRAAPGRCGSPILVARGARAPIRCAGLAAWPGAAATDLVLVHDVVRPVSPQPTSVPCSRLPTIPAARCWRRRSAIPSSVGRQRRRGRDRAARGL